MKNTVKVRIVGFPREGARVYEILPREELEKKIQELSECEIYKYTHEEASGYTFSGTAYTYISAKSGEIYTYWLQNNSFLHPFDSFYEIILCSLNSPIKEPYANDLLDDEEYSEFENFDGDVKDFLIEKYGVEEGEKEYQNKIENWIDYWASEFSFDWYNINQQLDELYSNVIEDEEDE